jgi:hypothetical protein
MTQTAATELEEILKKFTQATPTARCIIDDYSDLIAVARERRPPLSYAKLAFVINEKLKRDGRADAEGEPLTVTRQGINNFVLRRVAQSKKRKVEAVAVRTHRASGAANFNRSTLPNNVAALPDDSDELLVLRPIPTAKTVLADAPTEAALRHEKVVNGMKELTRAATEIGKL